MNAVRSPAAEPIADGYADLPALCQHPDRLVRRDARHALNAAQRLVARTEGCGIDMSSPPDEAAIDRLLREAGR